MDMALVSLIGIVASVAVYIWFYICRHECVASLNCRIGDCVRAFRR